MGGGGWGGGKKANNIRRFHLVDDLSAGFFHKHQSFRPLFQASLYDHRKEPSLTDRNIHLVEVVLHDSHVIFWEMDDP